MKLLPFHSELFRMKEKSANSIKVFLNKTEREKGRATERERKRWTERERWKNKWRERERERGR